MQVLIVYAHPEPHSFNGAMKEMARSTLTNLGHRVEVSDLYAMGWQAALSLADMEGERVDPEYFDPSREQEAAAREGRMAEAIRVEQEKVSRADLIIFQFPIWWFSMPAILKGWVDRVFARGFAYSAGRKYGSGHFKGKRAMLSLTTGTASSLYEPAGIDGDLLHVLWPIHNGILAYTGFTVLPPFAAWMPGRVGPEGRKAYLERYAERLRTLDSTEPLFFHPWEDYDEDQRLKPGVEARSGVQWNPRAGQDFVASATSHHATGSQRWSALADQGKGD